MKAALLFIFAAAFFAAKSPVVAQTERVSKADYNAALVKSLEASYARSRRVLTTETFYRGSRVVGSRKIVSEFAGPDAKRIQMNEEFGGKRSNKDSVQIGQQFFCRDGEKGWKKSVKDCSFTDTLAIPNGDYKYLVENDPRLSSGKIYIRRATFTDAGSAERDAVRLKSIEIRFVAGDNGIVEYTETRRGGTDPNEWSSTQVTKYEYDPADLKISDPTNKNL